MQTKIINISLPNQLLVKVDEIAGKEYRNRSELFREAIRNYIIRRDELAAIYRYGSQQAIKEKITSGNLNKIIQSYRKNK